MSANLLRTWSLCKKYLAAGCSTPPARHLCHRGRKRASLRYL